MSRAGFFGRAVGSVTAASLCGRVRRTQFDVSGFILLFALWSHALTDDAAIVHEPSLPASLVNSTVTEFLYDSGFLAQGPFGQDFWVVSLSQSVVLCLCASSSTLLRYSCSLLSVSSARPVPAGTRPLPCWRR